MARRPKPSGDLAVAYVRVSTEEQDLGPDVQIAAIEKWTRKHGIRLACPPFIDKGVSGSKEVTKRPALTAAMGAMADHNAGILVAHKRDRIARSRAVIGALMLELRRRGLRICTTDKAPGDPDDIDPMGRMMEGIQDLFAEYERAKIRQRTRQALAVKRSRGERIGTVPYGHRLAADGIHLVEDPKEQRVIALMRALDKDGLSLRAIAEELDKRGHMSKTGRRWNHKSVRRILIRGDK